jgi:hypothetical protein
MGQQDVLICDTQRRFVGALASGFRQLGWDVQTTSDEAEAGYRLLMWVDPDDLPQITILSMDNVSELLGFCSLLNDPEILTRVRVVAILDETAEEGVHELQRLGMIPVQANGDPWQQVKAILDRPSEGMPQEEPNATSMKTLRADRHDSPIHQHSEQMFPGRSRNSATAGKEH